MSNESKNHIVKYKTYFYVLVVLILLTILSVAVTGINLGRMTVIGALLLASVKSSLVLWYFMHLKYESKVLKIMVGLVLFLFVAVMIITFLDYSFQ
jgi:cytochrome c oxidase subunit 4